MNRCPYRAGSCKRHHLTRRESVAASTHFTMGYSVELKPSVHTHNSEQALQVLSNTTMSANNYKYQTLPKSTVLPSKPLKMYFGKPIEEPSLCKEDQQEELPLPDIVLCSALSAGIHHGNKIRERRRHKATIQTKGREVEDADPEDLMIPLVKDLEDMLLVDKVCMDPNPEETEEEEVDSPFVDTKRRRTSSLTETASKLSAMSDVAITTNKLSKTATDIDDTPEGVFNGIKQLIRNVFSN